MHWERGMVNSAFLLVLLMDAELWTEVHMQLQQSAVECPVLYSAWMRQGRVQRKSKCMVEATFSYMFGSVCKAV